MGPLPDPKGQCESHRTQRNARPPEGPRSPLCDKARHKGGTAPSPGPLQGSQDLQGAPTSANSSHLDRGRTGDEKGRAVPCSTTFPFHQVAAYITVSQTDGRTQHPRPSQGVTACPCSPGRAESARGNRGSGEWEKRNLECVYSAGREERRQAQQPSTGNTAKVFLN